MCAVGVVSKVLQMLRLPDGTIKVLFEGLYRAAWQDLREADQCLLAGVRRLEESQSRPEEKEALVRAAHESLEEYGKNNKKISQEAVLSILALHEPGPLADANFAPSQGGVPQKAGSAGTFRRDRAPGAHL